MGGARGAWGEVDDRESVATIHQALDQGVTLIDTAPIYGKGHSEEIVGHAIQDRRDQIILATKCGLLTPKTRNEPPVRCLKRDSILRECAASLRRLRTDHIDLYQCHWPDDDTPIRETMEALRFLEEQGKIRAIGLSNFSCDQIASAREYGAVHCIQPPFSMLNRRAETDLIPYCIEHKIGVIVYSPLEKGLLAGKFNAESTFDDLRAADPEFLGRRFRRNLQTVERLKPIAQRHGKTVAQLVINWTYSHEGVTAPIVGAKKPSQILENVGALGWTLEPDARNEIQQILETADRDE